MAGNSPTNVHSADNLSGIMLASLPTDSEQPQIKSSYDAIALASHAGMLAVGFRLVGLGEDHRIDTSSTPEAPQPLPQEWNAHNGNYAFRYKHSQSSMEFLLKCNRMGNKMVIMGMGMGDDRTCQFDVKASEFVSDGNLPSTPKSVQGSEEEGKRKIQDVFISVGRLSDLGSEMRIYLVQKLMPSLQKDGYQEDSDQTRAGGAQQRHPPERGPQRPDYDPLRDPLRDPQPARPYPLHDPLATGGPRRPFPEPIPGFEDEHQIQPPRPLGGMGGMPDYGYNDLYPQGLGPRDPLRGGVGPGIRPSGGGGMHPTFDDPLFAGRGQVGGGAFDPRAPPGSRYDPVGPGGPGGGHPRGAGMGGRPPNPFGGFGDGDFI